MPKKWSPGPERFSGRLNNHKLSLGATEQVTYHALSGTDSISSPYDIYFEMEREIIRASISVTVVCSLTVVNGETLKSPRTLNPGANLLDMRLSNFTILSGDATIIEVTVK